MPRLAPRKCPGWAMGRGIKFRLIKVLPDNAETGHWEERIEIH